jgi:eukaryotic-like serine/threonine-protein kinase
MALTSGTKLGPYEIVSPLGAGGMGEVYRARDTRLGRDVAIKVLPAEFASDADRLHRFEQEARVLSALNHPNLLAIHDVGTQDGIHYLVSELLEGESLRQRLSDGPLALRKSVDYGVQIAKGLAAAHEKGIVHRDLKPENVFITRDERLKILDFGLAKRMPAPTERGEAATMTSAALTDAGIVMGTVGYMSPEQVRGKPADARSDLFTCGVILYEMFTGVRAFRGDSSVEVMNAILKEDPPELPSSQSIPASLDGLMRRCLEKSPEERFQSARDLGFALQVVSGSSGVSGKTTAAASHRYTVWYGVLAALVLAGTALGTYLVTSSPAPATSPLRYHQLTYRHGVVWSARFAPDGQTILYSAAWDGKPIELFSTRAEFPESRSLALASADLSAISPSGEVALTLRPLFLNDPFLRAGTLATIPLAGGTPRELLEDVVSADYSPDGTTMAVVQRTKDRYRLEFPVGKTLYETAGYISDVRISRDGSKVAFLEHPFRGNDRGFVAVVDREGKKESLTRAFQTAGGLAWSPDDKEVWFTAAESGPDQKLRAVSLSGRARVLAEAPGRLSLHDVFRDGRVLLGHVSFRDGILGATPTDKEERDLGWLNGSLPRDISPDGQTLIFLEWGEAMGDMSGVCLRRMDGAAPVRLGTGEPQALSPDGKWVLGFIDSAPTQVVLYPTGVGQPRSLPGGNLLHQVGAFFADGKRILLVAAEANHSPRTYVQDLWSGKLQPLTPEGIMGKLLSPDERFLVVSNSQHEWFLYSLENGKMQPIPGIEEEETPIRFTSDGKALFTSLPRNPEAFIYRVEVVTGKRTLWKHLEPHDPAGVFAIGGAVITPDGRSYAYTCTRGLTDLYLVEGIR